MAQKQTKKMLEKEEILEEDVTSEVETDASEVVVEQEELEEEREEKEKSSKSEKKKNGKDKKKSSAKKEGYFKSLNKELEEVVWPKGSEVLKSTVAVIVICLILVGFFELTQLLVAFVKGLFV